MDRHIHRDKKNSQMARKTERQIGKEAWQADGQTDRETGNDGSQADGQVVGQTKKESLPYAHRHRCTQIHTHRTVHLRIHCPSNFDFLDLFMAFIN